MSLLSTNSDAELVRFDQVKSLSWSLTVKSWSLRQSPCTYFLHPRLYQHLQSRECFVFSHWLHYEATSCENERLFDEGLFSTIMYTHERLLVIVTVQLAGCSLSDYNRQRHVSVF